MRSIYDNCKIIKYADDTAVIGLVSNNDENKYRSTINYIMEWCDDNYLDLNVSKTKEIIFDFRKGKHPKTPIIINNNTVDVVTSYKYLGVTIQENLKWDTHIANQVKKASKRMYHVRCLRKLHVNSNIIAMFFNSVVSSVLVYAIPCFYTSCNEKSSRPLQIRQKGGKNGGEGMCRPCR